LAEHLGSDTFLKITTDQVGTITLRAGGEVHLRHGDQVRLALRADKIHRFGADGKAMA
jgi:multiple sugar transport system ATP-binding protein